VIKNLRLGSTESTQDRSIVVIAVSKNTSGRKNEMMYNGKLQVCKGCKKEYRPWNKENDSSPALRYVYLAGDAFWCSMSCKERYGYIKYKYGMTANEYNTLLVRQGGKCAICGYSDMSNRRVFPHIDHCHDSGEIRGLLCGKCNWGLGSFRDNPQLLLNAIDYLAYPPFRSIYTETSPVEKKPLDND